MRLIDPIELKRAISVVGMSNNHKTLEQIIDEQPTIEERKKGKWKRTYLDHEAMGERPSIFYCSVCNQCIAYPVNFCPNCGADMRGDDHEND